MGVDIPCCGSRDWNESLTLPNHLSNACLRCGIARRVVIVAVSLSTPRRSLDHVLFCCYPCMFDPPVKHKNGKCRKIPHAFFFVFAQLQSYFWHIIATFHDFLPKTTFFSISNARSIALTTAQESAGNRYVLFCFRRRIDMMRI